MGVGVSGEVSHVSHFAGLGVNGLRAWGGAAERGRFCGAWTWAWCLPAVGRGVEFVARRLPCIRGYGYAVRLGKGRASLNPTRGVFYPSNLLCFEIVSKPQQNPVSLPAGFQEIRRVVGWWIAPRFGYRSAGRSWCSMTRGHPTTLVWSDWRAPCSGTADSGYSGFEIIS